LKAEEIEEIKESKHNITKLRGEEDNEVMKVSSLSMMRRARYRPGMKI